NARICAYQQMKVWDEAMDGKIHFNAMDYFESDLGHIIEQQVILGALWQKLAEFDVGYYWGTKTIAQKPNEKEIELTLSSQERLQASLVIAADGANSSLRTLCEVSSRGWDYEQLALVATVKGTI